ncbi:MAG: DoxX family protein [Candidatus Azobacteroides sp.]|nr:DoxX family protein [Candidatus Azobacteroides sp.]
MKTKHKKIAVEISRIILGLVFIFSGFVKAIDPWGGAYKISDYFSAFQFTQFDFLALPLSFLQAVVEFGVGVCLLVGIYRRINSILALLIMLFMTPLTLYLSIANPVTDCGCFGDALVISNWQTFYKNIFLLIAAVIVFIGYRLMTPVFTRKTRFSAGLWIYLFIIGLSFYCFHYLPVLDFRPYKIGANIPEKMEVPENAEHDIYEVRLIYSKNGEQKEFTVENYPKDDSTWTFVDSKSRLIKTGYQPPVHDFSITNADGDDITEDVLSNPSYTFLLIAHKLDKTNDANVDKINDIYDFSKTGEYDFYALTSSLSNEIQDWIENTGAEYPFCTMDDITLKTIIRSNPGLLLIKGGTIINKWPNTRLPDIEELARLTSEKTNENPAAIHRSHTVPLLALILLVPLIGLFLLDLNVFKKTTKNNENSDPYQEKN